MEDTASDILQCEEQLRITLHCDDKEKLRRKLIYLQREYQRTAQRLQRAERSETVQRCVRSLITQQHNQKNQEEQEVWASPDDPSLQSLSTANVPGVHQPKGHVGGHGADSEKSRGQLLRFLLPLKAACPQTPISIHESATGHKPSPSLRLRSRRSRLRWERQSSVVGVSTDSSQDGQEQAAMMELAATLTTKGDKINPTEVTHVSDELISGADSDSPSLLPKHLSVFGQNGPRHVEEQAIQEGPEQRDEEIKVTAEAHKETQPSLLACKSLIQPEETEQAGTQCQRKKAKLEQSENVQMENIDKIVEDGRECEQGDDNNTVKEDKLNMDGAECDIKAVGLLHSCTLVEGLLFPAEYYVRTTRRMTSSQSQPDMQAVILSQLNLGRRRKGWGSGRRLAHNGGPHSQTSDTVGLCSKSQEAQAAAAKNRQNASKNSAQIPDCQRKKNTCVSDAVCAARPARGRKRGRGRARPYRSQCSFRPLACEHTSDNPQITSSPVSLSPSLHGITVSPSSLGCAAEEPKSLLTAPVPDETLLFITPNTTAEHRASGGAGTKDSPAHPSYPIFLKNSSRSNRTSQLSESQPLAMPSPPAPSLPLPSLSLPSLVKTLRNFDIQQDFHLPDDQFASLKLHKLRQVAVETGVEPFSSPHYCTRRSIQRYASSPRSSSRDIATPLPVPSRSTPTGPSWSNTAAGKHTCTPSLDDANMPTPPHPTELSEQEETAGPQAERSPESEPADPGSAADCVDGCKGDGAADCSGPFYPEENQGQSHTDSHTDIDTGSVLNKEFPAEETKKCSEPRTNPGMESENQKACLPQIIQSQLLLSPPLVSNLLTTPHLPPSSLILSPSLPSLGVTPQPVPAALSPTSSPSAPTLILPAPSSPSTQALSPPPLSPCPSLPLSQVQDLCQLVHTSGPHVSSVQSEGLEGKPDLETEQAWEDLKSCTHTLKTPSGGCLVDACCLPASSGRLSVAAAGKWAVCLWTQISASDWNLSHTWSFNEMVINVFAVPDAAGLICVTLGQLEIREVRILSCSSLSQVSLCDGVVQTVVGVSKSRVVTLSHSASGSAVWVFTLSDSGSTLGCQPLVSPGVCVGALSTVHDLPDALIGTDENDRLFIWNLNTGQLLQKVHLEAGFSHSACLGGYSYCGVLFVLLQHQFLSSHEEGEGEVPAKERKTLDLLSLVAINPLSGKSTLATRLYPPSAWSGRLCEVDVSDCSVVGLSHNGCVCVWELGQSGATRMVRAPESEGWQLARWGGGGTLLTGHHNGDVTLHRCSSPL